MCLILPHTESHSFAESAIILELEVEVYAACAIPRVGFMHYLGPEGSCSVLSDGKHILGLVNLGRGDDENPHHDTQGTSRDNIFEASLGFFRKREGGEAQQGTGQPGASNGVDIAHGIIVQGVVSVVTAALAMPDGG